MSYLTYNITSQVPNIRKQLITHYKNALLRYDASYNVIMRNLKKVTDNEEYKIIVDYYNNFIKSFAKLLISNLTVDANYSRRSASLELISIVVPYLKEHWIHCWRKEDVLNCQNILYDSYESNKKMALSILLKLPPELMGFHVSSAFCCITITVAVDCYFRIYRFRKHIFITALKWLVILNPAILCQLPICCNYLLFLHIFMIL